MIRRHLGAEVVIDDSVGVAAGVVPSDDNGDHERVGAFHAANERMAGPALAWALRSGITRLHLVAERDHAGALARRTADLDGVQVDVLAIDDTDLQPAVASEVEQPPVLSPSAWELASIMSEAGARPVDDHGRIVAEVAGLEVARIVQAEAGQAAIEVGVGEADRELHGLVHTTMDTDTALRRAVATVAAERRRGSLHPLSRMARERWLRSMLLDDPSLVGAGALTPVPPLQARSTVLGNVPIAAFGSRADGLPIVVVCSTGIDLDVVPEAADYRRRHDPDADLVIVVPERDRHAITESLVAITPRTELRAVAPPW